MHLLDKLTSLAVLTSLLPACHRNAPDVVPASEASKEKSLAASTPPMTSADNSRPLMCEDPLLIILPEPLEGGPTATFEVDPGGEIEPALGCQKIQVGDLTKTSQGDERFTIAAHERELQRITIGHTTVLVHIPPGTHVKIGTHPCFSWQFLSPDLSVEGASAEHASCVDADTDCPEGTQKVSTRLAVDPLCEGTPLEESPHETKRCVKPTRVSLSPPSAWTRPVMYADVGAVGEDERKSLPDPFSPPLALLPASCGFVQVFTGAERVGLAVGTGREWTLYVDPSGKLSGVVK